jgi:hypothetical protein
MYDAFAQVCRLPHRALIYDRVRFQHSQGAPRCDPKNLLGPMTRRRLALDGHDPAQCYQPLRTATLHPVVIAVDDLQRRLGGRCCKLGLNHRLGPKDSGWLVRLPRRQLLVFAVACRRCPFPLDAGLLACVWRSQLLAAVGVGETQCAAQFATAVRVVRVVLLRRMAGGCCWRDRPGRCRRPSPRCASTPLFKFVVVIVGGAGVSVTA